MQLMKLIHSLFSYTQTFMQLSTRPSKGFERTIITFIGILETLIVCESVFNLTWILSSDLSCGLPHLIPFIHFAIKNHYALLKTIKASFRIMRK